MGKKPPLREEIGAPNVPSPLPSSTVTKPSLVPWSALTVTRSSRPSPLTSPTASAVNPAPVPVAYGTGAWKVPSPLPRRTLTSGSPEVGVSITARSSLPSPLKSPATIGPFRLAVLVVVVTSGPKVPSPLPSATPTALPPTPLRTRSSFPSWLTSASKAFVASIALCCAFSR